MLGLRLATFLRENRWLMNLVFISLGSYFSAGAANAVVARSIRILPSADDLAQSQGLGKTGRNRNRKQKVSLETILERNLLGAKREDLVPVSTDADIDEVTAEGVEFDDSELKPCSLGAAVRATLVAEGAPEWSMAVIYDNSSRETGVYTVNGASATISDDATLVAIRRGAIVVRRRDHFELCEAEGSAKAKGKLAHKSAASRMTTVKDDDKAEEGSGITRVSNNEFTIERSEVDNALSNINKIATQAHIVPSFKNGKSNGFKLFSIKPGSIYSKIGLRNGDVIQTINGYDMSSPDKALEVYQKIKDASSISVAIERRGRPMTMGYSIR